MSGGRAKTGQVPTMPSTHTNALINAYVESRLERGELAASSVLVIVPILRQWACHIRHAAPDTWTTSDVAGWINHAALRASTRKSRLTKLRPFVRWLIRHGHLGVDPTDGFTRIVVPAGKPRDLTEAEVGQLLRACPDDRAVLIVLLMVHIGLRCGDVARIRIEDIDTRRRLLHVRAKGGRGEPTHWDPIPDQAWDALVDWIRGQRLRGGHLVRSYQQPEAGLQPATVSKMVGEWIRAAGLKDFAYDGRSAHALRHTCAQHMLDGGAELREVQFALGHRSIRSTELYTLREPPGLRVAMEGRSYRPAA